MTGRHDGASIGTVFANTELARHRFTLDEYHRMAPAGILAETDRVELIDGEIVHLAPAGRRHAACVAQVTRVLIESLGDRAVISRQSPVRLPRDSEPQPDVTLLRRRGMLLRPRAGHDVRRPARAEDVMLVIEVADVSYRYDRYVKLPLYARADIPEVWLVDLTSGVVEVHRQPGSRGYESLRTVRGDGTLTPDAFDDVALAAADLLPSA